MPHTEEPTRQPPPQTRGSAGVDPTTYIEVAIALYSLYQQLKDNKKIMEALGAIRKDLEVMKEALIRIERFLQQLPLIIDSKLEGRFIEFVQNRLDGLITMYSESRESLGEPPVPLTEGDRERLSLVHHDLSLEIRTIMGYGVPPSALVAIVFLIEDDCASILGHRPKLRAAALNTFANYFNFILHDRSRRGDMRSLSEYVEETDALLVEYAEYADYLEISFAGREKRWTTDWKQIRTVGNSKVGRAVIYRRENFLAKIGGDLPIGYTYQLQSLGTEEKTELIGEHSRTVTPVILSDTVALREVPAGLKPRSVGDHPKCTT